LHEADFDEGFAPVRAALHERAGVAAEPGWTAVRPPANLGYPIDSGDSDAQPRQ